ncbi:PBSX family phage terminase large subunit [Romboutsia sp.]|uniref:PBSX family phage terminase large subunit n=1 Tax=Romboutsia sp. TaxID=1965302 RepID=UPI002C8950D3|nr:PBSX family phage terminase large subunit [Romboutsia sp.]HSQ88170.1 PBSX family phage terminase large subunit [Romboutsia sp.]
MNFHEKQLEVLRSFKYDNPKILICSGAKRAGKTYVLSLIFIWHVAKYKDMNLSFILGGTSQASLRRNVINDLEVLLNREIKLSKDNSFELFGNKIYCFHGANSDAFKQMRGFTSAGAFLNEATTLHDSFVKEAISRCSYEGARIYMDTNPENPTHTVKIDYVDKDGQRLSNGQLNIKAFNFTLYDNTFLNREYVESIEASTPSGMFFDRDILGVWVASEGVVYKDFNKDTHYIKTIDDIKFKKYFAGVDWGYEHHGSIVVCGEDYEGNYYLIKEIARQHKEIDFWVDEAKKIKSMHGDITFYCDSARPEHVQRFRREGIQARNADKSVLSGIEVVSKLLKSNKLFVVENEVDLFKTEIYNYVWHSGKDEPVKTNDDVLDALRYALYSDNKKKGLPRGFINANI